jgi:hypothetical protein
MTIWLEEDDNDDEKEGVESPFSLACWRLFSLAAVSILR